MANACEERLKSALAAGDFTEAQRLVPAYSEAVVALLSEPMAQQESRQAIEAFQNLLSLARVMRAHVAAQLSKLQQQASYRYQVPPSDRHAWRFEA